MSHTMYNTLKQQDLKDMIWMQKVETFMEEIRQVRKSIATETEEVLKKALIHFM